MSLKTPAQSSIVFHKSLIREIGHHTTNCVECGLCVKECRLLQKNGTPGAIAGSYAPDSATGQTIPFECSLCGLCAAVCPPKIGLNPASLFLEMRREAVQRNAAPFSAHKRILNYEQRGTSKRYSFYGLPEGCDTVFFPGCTFSGTRPKRLQELFSHLQQAVPNLGIVLDCCAKPSRDLGREDFFEAMFGELRDYLVKQKIKKVLTLCPSCYKIFSRYGMPLAVQSVYDLLIDHPVQVGQTQGKVTVHDPCPTREEVATHAAVRQLIKTTGLEIIEMKHHGTRTICCGEGGAVACVNKELSVAWGDQRKEEAAGYPVVTYCAGCVNYLSSRMQTIHVLDLLFAPETTLAGKLKVARAPFTYLNRLLLKRRFRKMLPTATQRERMSTVSK